jgi:hypothetical protein
MSTLLTKTQLARRADMDTRTLINRIRSLGIEPSAMTPGGRLLFSESAVDQLKLAKPNREAVIS